MKSLAAEASDLEVVRSEAFDHDVAGGGQLQRPGGPHGIVDVGNNTSLTRREMTEQRPIGFAVGTDRSRDRPLPERVSGWGF